MIAWMIYSNTIPLIQACHKIQLNFINQISHHQPQKKKISCLVAKAKLIVVKLMKENAYAAQIHAQPS